MSSNQLLPVLEWGVPEEAVELAVLGEDPDASRGTFIPSRPEGSRSGNSGRSIR